MELRDKVIVVTGAGRGAGRSIALALAEEGARLALASRTVSELNAVRDEVKAFGGEVVAVPTDLSEPKQIEDLAQEILNVYGTVDVIINNAGWCPPLRLVQDTTIEDWNLAMDVNARGPFLLIKALLPTMLAKRNGHVINVSSDVARGGCATASAYGASKAAMISLGESLLDEVAEYGIRVINMVPGTMNTDQRWDDNPDFPRETVMEPEDFAQLVVSLLKLNDYVLVKEVGVRPIVQDD
jgi:3-oxoacyl-[acyl-carrier protein] reductase